MSQSLKNEFEFISNIKFIILKYFESEFKIRNKILGNFFQVCN